jgi:hypothetical protein
MKQLLLLLLVLIRLSANGQETFIKISGNYFRSTPFRREFSKFVDHLMNDPTLTDKKINKKNDSTLFFFEGIYSSHNPFFFKAVKTKIILAEKEVMADDTSKALQTIYVYQLVAYAPPGEEGIKDVKEEYDRFCRRYKKGFGDSYYEELKAAGKQAGEIRNFTFSNVAFYPLTAAWASSKDHTDNIFAITIRFKVFDNLSYLAETFQTKTPKIF